ncbi:MAG: hypothetical protein WAW78_13500 [Propioniciclava sp.]
MNDQELASHWDADHRLAAITTLASGLLVIIGTALFFTLGMGPAALVSGQAAGPMAVTMLGGLLLIVDVALLVVVVALAHTFSEGRSIGLTVTTGVATLATASAAAIHLVWVNLASNLETMEVPAQATEFATWLALNVWLLPLFGLLVGATLLALALALRASPFRFARRLGTASAVIGGLLVALAPFSGYSPDQSALVTAAVITIATVGISVLLVVALVRLGLLLKGAGSLPRPTGHTVKA